MSDHTHDFALLKDAYFKATGDKTSIGMPEYDHTIAYSTLCCRGCGEVKEVIAADYRKHMTRLWRRLVCFVGLAAMVGCGPSRTAPLAKVDTVSGSPMPCEYATVYQSIAGNWVINCEGGRDYFATLLWAYGSKEDKSGFRVYRNHIENPCDIRIGSTIDADKKKCLDSYTDPQRPAR